MSVLNLPRKKPPHTGLRILYRLAKLIPNSTGKFRMLLDLEWILYRLSLEQAYKEYGDENPTVREHSIYTMLEFVEPNDIVLDLGCKYGYIAYSLSQKAQKVVGIDFDVEAIEKAKQTYPRENLHFQSGEAIAYLDSQEETFTCLILSHILEHLDDPKAFLQEIATRFNKIYIEIPDFDANFLNHYRKNVKSKLIYTDIDHINEFDREDIKKIIEAAGLRITYSEYIFGVQKYCCAR
ncbi:MAG: class I SAM-dependent methyltransferase [Bacteroidota bacterium]